MTPTVALASAGFVATAVAFGPARMGFGLFLPAFRHEFGLSTALAGFIASGGFLAFFIALLLAAWLSARVGQRLPVIAGALSATAGFIAVAAASNSMHLAVGIALAGASAGFCWSPFNDAAERVVPVETRASALSAVSTGTTFGVAVAGALALGVTYGVLDWRGVWIVFALAALTAAFAAWIGVPRGLAQGEANAPRPANLFRREAAPLYGAALCFGVTNAVYVSFAADRVAAAGGLVGLPDSGASSVIFLAYGVCGIVGLATGWVEMRTGIARLLSTIFLGLAVSLVLVALAPGSWAAILVSAALHGAAVMMISAVFSFSSLRLFPGRGSLGFTAALIGLAAGSVLGPMLAGMLTELWGMQATFLIAAIPPLTATIWFATRRADALPGVA